MEYAEFLRVRRSLAWYAGILAALALAALALGHQLKIDVQNGDGSTLYNSRMALPLGALAPIGMFYAAIYGSSAGGSLNREYWLHDIAWTKPIARTVLALRYVLIDLAALTVLYALTIVATIAIAARFGIPMFADASLVAELVLGLCVAAMWYGLVQVLTFWLPRSSLSIGGILWPVALLMIALRNVPGPAGMLAHAIDVINPLAYQDGVTIDASGAHADAVWQAPAPILASETALFAVLFCGIAIAFWPRREA
jgi:hypothetical protein